MATRIFGRPRTASSDAGAGGAARVVEFALWLAWFTLLVRSLGAEYQFIRSPARLISELGAVLIILTSLYWMLKLRPTDERIRARRWAIIIFCVSLVPALYGLARGNSIAAWAMLGAFPFFSATGIVLGAQPAIVKRLETALFWQVAFGVVFAVYVLAFHPPASRGEWNGVSGLGLGKHANRALTGVAFMLPLIHRLPTWRATTVIIGLGLYIVLAISGSGRGPLLIGAVLLPLGFLVTNTAAKRPVLRPLLRAVALATMVLVLGLLATNRSASFGRYFSGQWASTLSRVTGGDSSGSFSEISAAAFETSATEFSSEFSRGAELKAFIEQTELLDLFVGRGFGGSWYSTFWRTEWGMVHIGPGHLVLQGGLPLLIVFSMAFALALLAAWKARHTDYAVGAMLYMIAFLQQFAQHGAIQDEYEVYLAWICVGIALTAGAKAQRSRQVRHAQVRRAARIAPQLLAGGGR